MRLSTNSSLLWACLLMPACGSDDASDQNSGTGDTTTSDISTRGDNDGTTGHGTTDHGSTDHGSTDGGIDSSSSGDDTGASTGGEPLTPSIAVELYAMAWNARDAEQRLALIEQAWHPDAVYSDPITVMQGLPGAGVDGLVQVIEANEAAAPGFSLALTMPVDTHGHVLRFGWSFTPQGGAATPGIDVGEVDPQTGQLRSITGFFGELPAPGNAPPALLAHADAWNEPDPDARLALLEQAMSPGAIFDGPTVVTEGLADLVEHIGAAQALNPGAQLVLTSGADAYGAVMRCRWALIDGGDTTLSTGLYFMNLADDGRFDRVVSFIDP